MQLQCEKTVLISVFILDHSDATGYKLVRPSTGIGLLKKLSLGQFVTGV